MVLVRNLFLAWRFVELINWRGFFGTSKIWLEQLRIFFISERGFVGTSCFVLIIFRIANYLGNRLKVPQSLSYNFKYFLWYIWEILAIIEVVSFATKQVFKDAIFSIAQNKIPYSKYNSSVYRRIWRENNCKSEEGCIALCYA